MGVGPLDQGGRRQFWGEGVRSSRRVPSSQIGLRGTIRPVSKFEIDKENGL